MSEPRVIDIPSYGDDRGVLVPVWNNWGEDDFQENNVLESTCAGADLRDVKRAYFIQNSQKDVVRGFHYHEHETKYFVVVQGMAKFITVSMTPEQAEEMRTTNQRALGIQPEKTFTLSARKQQMLIVPPHNANGWMSLTDDCLLLALSSSTFEQSKNDDTRIRPDIAGDIWSVGAR